MSERLICPRVPYIPITVRFGQAIERFEALLDTGFTGEVIVPERLAFIAGQPDASGVFRMADGTEVIRPTYEGFATIGLLGSYPVRVVALGDECLIGLRLATRFTITIDHDRRLLVEP